MSKQTINGRITEAALRAWVEANRPDLAIREEAGVKGFYRRSAGPAQDFQSCGRSWRDVAATLGAVEVRDDG